MNDTDIRKQGSEIGTLLAKNQSLISKETEFVKLQEKQDDFSVRLLGLQQVKQEYEAKKIMDAFHKSGKSLQELMTFLDV